MVYPREWDVTRHVVEQWRDTCNNLRRRAHQRRLQANSIRHLLEQSGRSKGVKSFPCPHLVRRFY